MPADKELKYHQQTWHSFTRLLMWCTGGVIVLLALMALTLT